MKMKNRTMISFLLIFLFNTLLVSLETWLYVRAEISSEENNAATWLPIFITALILYTLIPLVVSAIRMYRIRNLQKTLTRMPWEAAMIIVFTGAIWSFVFAFPEAVPPDERFITYFFNYTLLYYLYVIFPAGITLLLTEQALATWKVHLFHDQGLTFPPGRSHISIKLIFLAMLTGIFPTAIMALNVLDLYTPDKGPTILAFLWINISLMLICIIVGVFAVTQDLLRPIRFLLDSFRQISAGKLDTRIPVTSREELGVLTHHFNEMANGLEERELIREAFGQYVSPAIAEKIINRRNAAEGEERLVSILFTDIEGYTSLSENLSPHETIEMLNAYFSDLISIVNKHNGTVNKFMGDALMVLFNAPQDLPHHATEALECAQEILTVTSRKYYPGNHLLPTRIGINSGFVVAGRVGGEDRFEYTILGDAVNLAQRLEQLNKETETQLLFSHSTAELVKGKFPVQSLGKKQVKGREEAVEIYTLYTPGQK